MINKKEKNEIKEGFFDEKDFISPSYINLNNPRFLEIDDYFYSGITIVNYYREYNDLILKSLIETSINMNISVFYEKKETSKVIKELTYNIGNVGVELKQSNESRQDIDIAAFTYNDAKYIRKELQINNEDMYFLYIYLTLFSTNKKELEYNLDKIEGILQSKGLQTRRTNFRQEQLFISCLPLMENKEELKIIGKRNILTSGLISTYPFISSSIVEEEGIYIGNNMYNNSLILIDRYNTNKYKNANMCIFGTSGAGKSFYTKLLILRNTLLGIEQYVIDPEREYNNIAQNLGGTIIKIGPTSENYINIFDIRKESIEENEHGYLATKIGKLIGFFNLIFGELNEEEKAILEEKLIQTYKKKNITFNDKTLYKKGKFKTTKDMPILEDLYNNFDDERTKKFKIKLIPFIKGSLKFFNNYTNIELNKKLIIADVYELGEENMKYGMYLFTELFWDKIKINRKINIFKSILSLIFSPFIVMIIFFLGLLFFLIFLFQNVSVALLNSLLNQPLQFLVLVQYDLLVLHIKHCNVHILCLLLLFVSLNVFHSLLLLKLVQLLHLLMLLFLFLYLLLCQFLYDFLALYLLLVLFVQTLM